MKVYKVLIENNTATSAIPVNNLQHNDIGFKPGNETVQWLALECNDENTAIEIANLVVKNIWGRDAA